MKIFSIKRTIGFCGSCIAFYIGAGFATMQEVMQYEASYGSLFGIVIAVAAIIYIYTNISFASNGNRLQLTRGGDIYRAYCGEFIGKFFDYFSSLFCYMCFIVMCGGANSTVMQQWGLPNGAGAIIIAILSIGTVILGLKGILKTLGKIGPIIISFIFIIAIVATLSSFDHFSEGLYAIDNGIYNIEQVGGGNPFASGISYGGFVILWFAPFLAEIGAKNKLSEVNIGMLISSIAIFGVAAISCMALISNIKTTWNSPIPALVLSSAISPLFTSLFAIIIFLGIYTTAVPLLWTGVRMFSEDGTKKYEVLTVIGGILGCIIACFLPYKELLNVIYGLNGYLGFVLVVFMIFNDIGILIKYKRKKRLI